MSRRRLVVLFVAAGVLRVVLLPFGGFQNDVTIFVGWAHVLLRDGTHALYTTASDAASPVINYPPGYALVLATVASGYRAVAGGATGPHADALLKIMLKAPAAVADLLLAALAYRVVRRTRGERDALVASAIALFGPWTWPISALWGQVDSLCTLGLACALVLAGEGAYTASFVALAAGALVKPFPLLLAPLVLIAEVRARGLSVRTLAGPLAGVGLGYLASLPFAPGVSPTVVLPWLIAQYRSGQSLFPMTSINADNLWTVASAPQSDVTRAFGLTLQTWGWIAFLAVAAAVAIAFARRSRSGPADADVRDLAVASFVVLAALFVLATRMHERYLIYALSLAPFVWFGGRLERFGAAAFAVTFSLDVGLDQVGKRAHVLVPVTLTHAISLANVLVLAALAVHVVRRWASRGHVEPPERALA